MHQWCINKAVAKTFLKTNAHANMTNQCLSPLGLKPEFFVLSGAVSGIGKAVAKAFLKDSRTCTMTNQSLGTLILTYELFVLSGAASGIGKAVAKAFLDAGACVLGLDVNPDTAKTFNSPSYRKNVYFVCVCVCACV